MYLIVVYLNMTNLKTKWFEKWSKKRKITDSELVSTLSNIKSNIGSESLGSGLFKVRLARKGEGKSGGYRTFIIFKTNVFSIFVFGIAKNEKENLSKAELIMLRKMAKNISKLKADDFEELKNGKNFILIKEGKNE